MGPAALVDFIGLDTIASVGEAMYEEAAAIGLAFLARTIGDSTGSIAERGLRSVSAWPSWLFPLGWVSSSGRTTTTWSGIDAGTRVRIVLAVQGRTGTAPQARRRSAGAEP
jgi:ABC-2 type transport system permease protein